MREHRVHLFFDAERRREVQRRLDDEQVGGGAEPENQIGGVAVAAQPHDRQDQCEHRADDDGPFEDGQGPVLQRRRVTELDESTCFLTGETEFCCELGKRGGEQCSAISWPLT